MQPELSLDERVELTRVIFRILKRWQIPEALMGPLLGLGEGLQRRQLNRYRLGNPLPQEAEIQQRLLLLIQIDKALSSLFPHSALSANLWVTTPQQRCANITPLEEMVAGGMPAIRTVLLRLDNRLDW
ncbi:hypothetical protein QQ73_03160 [Candidatus Endoriftia persephone str. Guaymas]|nr:hypothetical protein [Candidatus Endoriftia persephone str. Guaymas]